MPRKYIRKTDTSVDEKKMKKAIRDYLKNKIPIRESARLHNINRNTLMSRLKVIRRKNQEEMYLKESDSGMSSGEEDSRKFHNKYTVNQVFSVSEETDLANYIKQCSNLHYGLSYKQIRLVAFDYASSIPNCKVPMSWNENKIAGMDWLFGFMSRPQQLSLRKPESTSILRATGFNKDRVNEFFEIYIAVLECHKFKAEKIFNLDETGVSTVMKPVNVVSQKGKKQVGQVASGERGENVTLVGIVHAIGNTVPPVYIVPRVRSPEDYITGAPESSLVLGNKSGWMTKELFPRVLEHIKEYTNCSKESPILLTLDNHSSHISLDAIKFCKSSGICLVSFPPHTTHRMQPLDIGVFGPFKSALSIAFDDWLISNPGKTITIRNVGELTNKAYTRSFISSNIINAFKKPGLWPLDRLAFSDEDYLASTVTDKIPAKPSPRSEDNPKADDGDIVERTTLTNESTETSAPSCSKQVLPTRRKLKIKDIRPYPKSDNIKNKSNKNIRRQTKSKIYTSTPVMDELEELERVKQRKISVGLSKTTNRKIMQEDSDSSEVLNEEIELADLSSDDSSLDEYPLSLEPNIIIREGDFVLAKFPIKTNVTIMTIMTMTM